MTKFIVVGVQRTGTTLIRTTLDNHSQVRCAGESFKAKRWRVRPYMGDLSYQQYIEEQGYGVLFRRLCRSAITKEFLQHLYSQPNDGAIGFKFMADQSARFPAVVPYVKEHGIKVIHVVRENTLKTWVSILTAKARGGFHHEGTGAVEEVKVNVPIATLLKKLQSIYDSSQQWAEVFQPHADYTQIKYEEFVSSRASEMVRLCDFLNVQHEQAESELKKLNSDDLADLIENYDQVRAALKCTSFEWCTE